MTTKKTGKKNSGNRRHYYTLFLAALLVSAILLAMVVLQDRLDSFPHRETQSSGEPVPLLQLNHPTRLSLANDDGRDPLLVLVSSADDFAPLEGGYALWVSIKEPGLTVLDIEGKPTGARPLATAPSAEQLGTAFFVAATNTDSELPRSAEISVSIAPLLPTTVITGPADNSTSIPVIWPIERTFEIPLDSFTPIPTPWPPEIGWLIREIAQRADTLALLFAILIGAWEWGKWSQEKIEREEEQRRQQRSQQLAEEQIERDRQREEEQRQLVREQRIESVAARIQRNWVDGIAELTNLLARSTNEMWGAYYDEQIVDLQRRYYPPERFGEYLAELGRLHRKQDNFDDLYRRLQCAICFGDTFENVLVPCLRAIDSSSIESADLDSLQLLMTSFPDARYVVEAIIDEILNEKPELKHKIINESGHHSRTALRMIILRIGLFFREPVYGRWSVFPDGQAYSWPAMTVLDGNEPLRTDDIYLTAHSFSDDPFSSTLEGDTTRTPQLNYQMILISSEWILKLRAHSSALMADSFADSVAWTTALPQQMSNHPMIFPLVGFVSGMRNDVSSIENCLTVLARIASARWLDLIGTTPDAFLAQPEQDMAMLYDLLLWYCGSIDVLLRSSMPEEKKYDTTRPDPDRPDILSIKLFRSEVRRLETQRQRVSAPTHKQFIEWLSVRPPGIFRSADTSDATVLLALLPPETAGFGFDGIDLLAQELAERRVYFHFVGERRTLAHVRSFRTRSLSWTPEEIQAMIDTRIVLASSPDGPQTFAELTDYISLGDKNPYTDLLAAARGSLHRALEYCRVAVQIHLASDAPDGLFTDETLRKAREAMSRVRF